jgi:ribonuclease Z
MVGQLKEQGWIEAGNRVIRLEEVSRPRPGQGFALVMDTRPCRNALRLAENVDLLLSEATYLSSERQQARAYRHLTAAQAAAMAKKSGVGLLVLAHYSQRYPRLDVFASEASSLHANVIAARDLQVIPIPPRSRQDTPLEPECG